MGRTDRKLIAFVAYAGVSPLDLVGPLTVLRDLKLGTAYRTVVVAADPDQFPTDTPLEIVPAASFRDVPRPFAVFVPGGGPATVAAMRDEALVGYVRAAAASAEIVGSTGNGALILAAAGLLAGRRVASHWAYADLLDAFGATWTPDRWVEDGRLLTAAGGTAGIDAMLQLTARLRSRSAARLAQLWMEYDPKPPFGPPGRVAAGSELGSLLRARPAPAPPTTGRAPSATGSTRKQIAVVLYPALTALDLVGPLQVLAELERFAPELETVVVGERVEPMTTDVGLSLVPRHTFSDVPNPFAILVPGGRLGTIRSLSDPAIRAYVSTAAASADYVTSVCTGSLILAAVGLLEGRTATTNWAFEAVLERLGSPYVRERWVHDGRFVLSAGVSAGIDMAIYLAALLTDETMARTVQEAIDYDPAPPFGIIDWERLPVAARLARGTIDLAAPFIARRPKRLMRAAKRAASSAPVASRAR